AGRILTSGTLPGPSTDYAINARIRANGGGCCGGQDNKLTLVAINDGTSNTIFVGQKSLPQNQWNSTNGSNWDEGIWQGGWGGPGRSGGGTTPVVVQDSPSTNYGDAWGGPFPGGCPFVFCDGSVRPLPYAFNSTYLYYALSPNDGQSFPFPD